MNINNKKNKFHASSLMPNDTFSQKILRERSQVFSKEEENLIKTTKKVDYIKFRLSDGAYYGISYEYAQNAIDHVEVTALPNTIDYIAGITNQRGHLLNILDLNKFFNLSNSFKSNKIHMIVVRSSGIMIGMLVEEIIGNAGYDLEEINDMPFGGLIDKRYIVGLHEGITSILNVTAIMNDLSELLNSHKENKYEHHY